MKPRTLDVLIAWALGILALVALATLMTGCGMASPTAASDFTPVEQALVDDTARWAGQLGVSVRGEITTQRYDTPQGRAAGWYQGGVAYYDREMVAEYVRLVPTPGCETASNVAAHEVAHAIYSAHDISHWCCTVHMGAVPTYPAPVAGAQCEGRAQRCLTNH